MANGENTNRTKQIPINASGSNEQSFNLNVEAASPIESVSKSSNSTFETAQTSTKKISSPTESIQKSKFKLPFKIPAFLQSTKTWNFIEWIATSAFIFMVLFFIMNWQSYSQLFVSKLNIIKGDIKNNPYYQELTHQAAQKNEKPLPLVTNPAQANKQYPPLNLPITPPDDRIVIPRINQNVPIVQVSTEKLISRDWGALEKEIQQALRDGVVHYPGTALPGDKGNVVVTGHSSYFPWDPGRFKDVFALLHQVEIGDRVIYFHDQQRYEYEVYDKIVVNPDQVDVLTQKGDDHLTLITCTPVGTNLRRLIVLAKPVQ